MPIKQNIALFALILFGGMNAMAVEETTAVIKQHTPPVISGQGISVEMGENGAQIKVDDVPFNKHGEFTIMDKNWRTQFFSYAQVGMIQATRVEGNKLITPLKGDSGFFTGQLVWELNKRNLTMTVDGSMNTTEPSQMQCIVASVFPEWYSGADFIVTKEDGTTSVGKIPTVAPTGEFDELTLAHGFKQMEIASPIGKVTMRPKGNFQHRFVDYRKNKYGDANMQFLCGPILANLDCPTSFTFSMEFEFGKIAPIEKRELTSNATPQMQKDALKKVVFEDRVIPTPKDIKWGKGTMPLTEKTAVTIRNEQDNVKTEEIAGLADNLIRTVKSRIGIDLQQSHSSQKGTSIQLVLTKTDPKAKIDQYRVKINSKTAVLESSTTSGLFCAVQTFRQLLRPSEKAVRCATVNDYATMSIRGVHFFTGHGEKARDIQVEVLHNILGEFKLNTLIYEASYINWKCLPQEPKLFKYSMEPELVRDVIKAAKEEFIDLIPMVNSYGHSEWLLDNDKRTHLADNQKTNYTYDVTNPEVYKIVEKVYAECYDLFKPRAIHIGHDEIATGAGKYPLNKEAQKIGKHQLFINDTMHWYTFLRDKLGVQIWMWSDMLYHHSEVPDAGNAPTLEEAKDLRNVLPKDITVVDWHYAPVTPDKFTGLAILNKAGFNSVSATWDTLTNISNFAKATTDAVNTPQGPGKTLGMVHTTWAGYSFDENSLNDAYQQYAQYVYAAEMMWNGGQFGGKPYDWASAFSNMLGESPLPKTAASGFAVPIVSKPQDTGNAACKIQDCGPYAGRFFVGDFAKTGEMNGVILAGMFNNVGKDGGRGITKMHVQVQQKAKTLIITATALNQMKSKEKVAEILVVYEDETNTRIPLTVGYETNFIFDGTARPNLEATKLPDVKDQPNGYLYSYAWANPHPDKVIKHLELNSECSRSGVYVRGITGLN